MAETSGVVYTFDRYRENAIGVEAPEANAPAYVERRFMNFDGVEGLENRDYKTVKSVYPLGRIPEGSEPVMFSWAATDHAGDEDFDLTLALPYDGITEGQLDHMAYGRFHSIRIDYDDVRTIKITGYNLDVEVQGRRG